MRTSIEFDNWEAILLASKWRIRDWSDDGLQMPDRDATRMETEMLDMIAGMLKGTEAEVVAREAKP